jgi:ketosteroid isomerase-like protein
MSEENVEIVQSVYEGWSKGDMSAGVELFDTDVEFASYMPDSNKKVLAHGVEGIAAFMREFLMQFRNYRLTADEIQAIRDDSVLVTGRQIAVGRQSGVAVEDGSIYTVWRLRGGKVVGLYFDRNKGGALEAAGLSE